VRLGDCVVVRGGEVRGVAWCDGIHQMGGNVVDFGEL
jgi:hypothetical protein